MIPAWSMYLRYLNYKEKKTLSIYLSIFGQFLFLMKAILNRLRVALPFILYIKLYRCPYDYPIYKYIHIVSPPDDSNYECVFVCVRVRVCMCVCCS